ncbi:MAG TPA: HAMP domain-containing histidine kinase [Candidatus Eisenbergiella merdipullorum]|uniref:histidine kinase n=1 Tax=Candidatus Eisenbergiella merdipullorum TaxID=2838553 RepID=A0A9D2L1F6_9FIRM|nr:HAMP domain-containing histidine kinase [Candidatus Eisenbergiella merdipullorum]
MVVFLLFVLVVSVLLLGIKWNNFYGLMFTLGFLSIELLIFVIIVSTAKFATFSYHSNLEYDIYRLLIKIRLNYFDLKRIVNFSVWLFAIVMLLIAWKNSARTHKAGTLFAWLSCACMVSVWILLFDSVEMQERIFIAVHTGKERLSFLKYLIQTGELFWLLVCCVLPTWKLIRQARNTRLMVRKKYLYAVLASTAGLAAVFLCMAMSMPIRNFLWDYQSDDFQNLYGFYQNSFWGSRFIWPILFFVIVAIIFCLARFDILREKSFLRKRKQSNSKISMHDLRHVFHTYKNALFSIECMCDTALEKYGQPEGKAAVENILSCAVSYHGQINRFLDIYNRSGLQWDRFSMRSALEEAEKRCGEGAKFDLQTETENDVIFGDYGAVVEMFVNLFQNALDAIRAKGLEEGEIQVSVWEEDALACVSIRDNGEGMDKETKKNLYAPFYTTKKTFHNWGIGMSQIRKTVDLHQGFIDVDSRRGEYTEFQIAIPLDV